MTQFVFVTGGVVSSLGKGIAAASLAAILATRGVRVTNLKLTNTSLLHAKPCIRTGAPDRVPRAVDFTLRRQHGD